MQSWRGAVILALTLHTQDFDDPTPRLDHDCDRITPPSAQVAGWGFSPGLNWNVETPPSGM
jgi:hypothetical protein